MHGLDYNIWHLLGKFHRGDVEKIDLLKLRDLRVSAVNPGAYFPRVRSIS